MIDTSMQNGYSHPRTEARHCQALGYISSCREQILPKRNWTHQTASLRTFLHTGALGPVNVDLTMLEVAALLGPPGAWITDAHDSPVPTYWAYNYLEIEFQPEPPYAINWFQIEHPDSLDRPRHKLADLLVLSMDRINVSSPPSRMLRHLHEIPDIVVGMRQDIDDPVLEICAGNVCLIYCIMDVDLKASPDMEGDPHGWLRHFDRHCFIDSIYSFRQPALQHQYPKDKFRNMSAQEYLAITRSGAHP